jgi:hypothetical protein
MGHKITKKIIGDLSNDHIIPAPVFAVVGILFNNQ